MKRHELTPVELDALATIKRKCGIIHCYWAIRRIFNLGIEEAKKLADSL